MEARNIGNTLVYIEQSIANKKLNESARKKLYDRLQKLKEGCNELICPISKEYFSSDTNPPYTIVTNNDVKTIVSMTVKQNFESTKKQVDPITGSNITGYVENMELKSFLRQKEHDLDLLEKQVLAAEKLQAFTYSGAGKAVALQITLPASEQAMALYEKMKKEWSLPVKIEGNIIQINASPGVGHRGVYEELLLSSDVCMRAEDIREEIAIAFQDNENCKQFVKMMDLSRIEGSMYTANAAVYFNKNVLGEFSLPSFAKSPFIQFPAPVKPVQDGKILLYRSKNNELAVKFPDVPTANAFIQQLGGVKQFKNEKNECNGSFYPLKFQGNETTFYFPGYPPAGGEFTARFPTEEMREKFFNLIIVDENDKQRHHTRIKKPVENRSNENMMVFNDRAFLELGSNIALSVPNVLKEKPVLRQIRF